MPKFTVEKSITIDKPIAEVFSYLRDFKEWPTWSPWLLCEPGCSVTFADDGNSYAWEGAVIGSGSMAVKEETENHSIDYDLTFLKPWKSTSDVRLTFGEVDGGTRVMWTMNGALPIFLFWMKPMMVAFIGMDYERGLAMLKDQLETGSIPSKLEFEGTKSFPAMSYVAVKNGCAIADIGPTMEADMAKVKEWLESNKTKPSGAPFSIYHKWDMVKGRTEYSIGYPVTDPPEEPGEGLVSGEIPACSTFDVKHTGSYRHLTNAWSGGIMHARSKQFVQNKAIHPFETYEKGPEDAEEADLVTVVHFPTK